METQNKTPNNQKLVYAAFANIYDLVMSDSISTEKAVTAIKALAGMNRTVGLEIKIAQLKNHGEIRSVEAEGFSAQAIGTKEDDKK